MGKRFKIVKIKQDQRRFTRTATKTKKINVVPMNHRGGTCL